MTKTQNGFTVVELLVTLFVVAGTFITIATTYAMLTRLADKTQDFLAANSIAHQKLQQFENEEFAYIPSGPEDTPYEFDFADELPATLTGPREGKVFITAQTPTLKYVFVRVTYYSTGAKQVLEYGSYIQQGGLGR